MDSNSIYAWCIFLSFLPFLTVVVILTHYYLFRVRWFDNSGHHHSRHKQTGFNRAPGGLSVVVQSLTLFYRPQLVLALETQQRQVEDVDEDDDGDPESPQKHFMRQLWRIRRGDPVETLVLRL